MLLLGTAMIARAATVPVSPNYSFAYDVQDPITGDSKAQIESRNGPLVQGSYSLIDPDNTRRTVHYTADDLGGFRAVVVREPLAAAPFLAPAPAPAPVPAVATSGPDSDVEVVDVGRAETLAKVTRENGGM